MPVNLHTHWFSKAGVSASYTVGVDVTAAAVAAAFIVDGNDG
jgi:hypothetical protein